jgi:hypothetical protein
MGNISISPGWGVVLMMNNYFHDVATALLMASGVALWFIVKRYDNGASRETTEYFLRVYRGMTSLAKFSLYWILIGGVPRILFYREMEWQTALDHAQIPALIVKHILAFTFVGMGVHLWLKFNKRVKEIKASMQAKEA